jgi:hypothetical protein
MKIPRRNHFQHRQATHKSSNTRSAYARSNSMRHAAVRTVTNWTTGSARKKKSGRRDSAPPPPDFCTHSQPESEAGPGSFRGPFSCAGESHTQSTHVPCQIPNSPIQAERSIIEAHGRIRRSPAYHSKAWQSQLGPSHAAHSSRRYRVRSGGQAITPHSGTVRRLGGASELVRAK